MTWLKNMKSKFPQGSPAKHPDPTAPGHVHPATDYSNLNFTTTETQKGLGGQNIVTGGTAIIPGNPGQTYKEAGVDPVEAQKYWDENPEEYKKYIAGKEDIIVDRKRNLDFEEVKEEKPKPPKTYDFKITDPDDPYGPALDVNWDYPQIRDWAKNKYGNNWKNSPHIVSWMKQLGLSFRKPGSRGRRGKNTQNISDYTYQVREQ